MKLYCSLCLALALSTGLSLAQEGVEHIDLPGNISLTRNIPYFRDAHEKQKLDIYLPRAGSERPYPLVVWIHGGGWAKGSKDRVDNCEWVLDEGYALASVGYRLTDAAKFPAQLDDCKAAIRFLKDQANEFGYDPDRIVVWGSSAGGHLVSMLGTTGDPDDAADDIDGAVNWFGPSDLLTMQKERTLPTQLDANAPDSFESRLVGGTLQEHPDKARAASPLTHVTPDDTPFLIMHGDQDALVPLKQSEKFVTALEKAGVPVELVVLSGAGHGGKAFQSDEARNEIRDFLEERFAREK